MSCFLSRGKLPAYLASTDDANKSVTEFFTPSAIIPSIITTPTTTATKSKDRHKPTTYFILFTPFQVGI